MLALFRTDCDAGQGMGHAMRCIALARAMEGLGVETAFACSKREGIAFAQSSGFDVVDLCGVGRGGEFRLLSDFRGDRGASLIVADSYEYDAAYLCDLGAVAPVVYIDDLHTPGLGVEAIINGNITADELRYRELYPSGHTKLLVGARYSLLRDEFCGLGDLAVRDGVRRVLVASGGSDPHGASVLVAEALLACPSLRGSEIVVMAGSLSGSVGRLRALSSRHPRIVVRQGVEDVARLMRSCDMAVAAAGGTMNELCACGVPSIAYALAENQVRAVGAFATAHCALNGGTIWDEGFAALVAKRAEELAENAGLRARLSASARSLFDGRGAARLARKLQGFMATGSWET